jgi:hypothetical protein
MRMRSYAVYNADTGEVVHLHVEPADSELSRDELLAMAAPGAEGPLDVLEVSDARMPAGPFRVENGELREVEDGGGTGRGGGAERFPESEVKPQFERVRPRGDEPRTRSA